MSDFNEINLENDDEPSDHGDIIVLTDDEGNEIHFEILDLLPFNNKHYIVLIPFEDLDDEVVILEVVDPDSEEPEYLSIDDEKLLYDVFNEFKKRNADSFDFAD